MERILCPDKLDKDPNSPDAQKEYKYWKKTFENFLAECGENAPDKLRCLTKYISPAVYEYLDETTTYEDAMSTLDKLYIKKKNEIFARYLLSTRRQKMTESLDEFLQELHKLSKGCELKAVTAEQYREELVRDAFINGLLSQQIRQRLLENQSLSLFQAYEQARALDSAPHNAERYAPTEMVAATTSNTNGSDKTESLTSATDTNNRSFGITK